jgi:hypothetical protein
LREGVPGRQSYGELIEEARELLKSRDSATGKTRKFNLDSTVLTEDGSIPTDEDIDDFFNQQQQEYQALKGYRSSARKQLAKLKLAPEDEDLLLALRYNAD